MNRWKSVQNLLKRGGILPNQAKVIKRHGDHYLQCNSLPNKYLENKGLTQKLTFYIPTKIAQLSQDFYDDVCCTYGWNFPQIDQQVSAMITIFINSFLKFCYFPLHTQRLKFLCCTLAFKAHYRKKCCCCSCYFVCFNVYSKVSCAYWIVLCSEQKKGQHSNLQSDYSSSL